MLKIFGIYIKLFMLYNLVMEKKELLKVYNEIFYSDLPHIDFLIKNKALTFECVDFICRELNFVARECENNAKMFKFWFNYSEALKLKRLIEKLEQSTIEHEKQSLQTEIDALKAELKPKMDVSQEEGVVWANKNLKKFLILRKELQAISQIESGLVDVTPNSDLQKVLAPISDDRKIGAAESIIWANQLVNYYFDKLGLTKKPNLVVGDNENSVLYDFTNNPLSITINKQCFKNLNNKTEKRKFAKTIIKNCAYAYTQVALTNPKTLKGKHSYAALLGIGLIDSKIADIEIERDMQTFADVQISKFLGIGKENTKLIPAAKFEELMLNEYIGRQVITEFRKTLKKNT